MIITTKYLNLKDFVNNGFINKRLAILFVLRNRIGENISHAHIKNKIGIEYHSRSMASDYIKWMKENDLLLIEKNTQYKLTNRGFWLTTILIYSLLHFKFKNELRRFAFNDNFIRNIGILEKTYFPKKKYISYDWPIRTKILFYYWNHPKKSFSPQFLKLKMKLSYYPYAYLKILREIGLIENISKSNKGKNKQTNYTISNTGIVFGNQLLKQGFTNVERNCLFEDDFMLYFKCKN